MFALLGLVLITHAKSLIDVSKDKSRMCKILAVFLLDNRSCASLTLGLARALTRSSSTACRLVLKNILLRLVIKFEAEE